MLIPFTAEGKTIDEKSIYGFVVIDSVYIDLDPGIRYRIPSWSLYCEDVIIQCVAGNEGRIDFAPGPPGTDTIVTTSGSWKLGDWENAATGVWFRHVDYSHYSGEVTLGKLNDYQKVPPIVELCADMVTQGEFQPSGRLWLMWNLKRLDLNTQLSGPTF